MSDLTAELNLALAVDNDDQADYLVTDSGLRGSLKTLDGLFNSSVGHTHNGAHQGGVITSIPASAIPDGAIGTPELADGAATTPKIADGAVTASKFAAGAVEGLFAGSLYMAGANYTVVKASSVMWVWAQAAGITITLTAGIDRPITIRSNSGTVTIVSTSGTVVGGSVDTASGTVQNGKVFAGDALTYKFDGTNWYAV